PTAEAFEAEPGRHGPAEPPERDPRAEVHGPGLPIAGRPPRAPRHLPRIGRLPLPAGEGVEVRGTNTERGHPRRGQALWPTASRDGILVVLGEPLDLGLRLRQVDPRDLAVGPAPRPLPGDLRAIPATIGVIDDQALHRVATLDSTRLDPDPTDGPRTQRNAPA